MLTSRCLGDTQQTANKLVTSMATSKWPKKKTKYNPIVLSCGT